MQQKTITVAIKKDTATYLGGIPMTNQLDLVPQVKERLGMRMPTDDHQQPQHNGKCPGCDHQ